MKYKKPGGFEFFDHTADIILKARGSSLKRLFENAARGMFSLMVSLGAVEAKEEVSIELTATSKENLLIDWLNELLFQAQSKRLLFSEFLIETITPTHIKAKACGERINKRRHHLKSEIKAATYHELLINQDKNGWCAQIILDV